MSIVSQLLYKEESPKEDKLDPLRDLKGVVYRIFNKQNGQSYIGKTVGSFSFRYPSGSWWKHSSNKLLRQDYEKYGSDAFMVEILESGHGNERLLELESLYIFSYNTFVPHGYNLHYDSDPLGSSGKGRVSVAKLKSDKIYVFAKDGKDDLIKYYMNTGSGGPCSDETKRKISASNKGKKRTLEQCRRIGESKIGIKPSKETIEKRSLSLKGKHSIPIIQIDPKTKECIKEYSSIQDAAKALGLSSSANLSSVCKGRQKTAGGFIFKYKNETT